MLKIILVTIIFMFAGREVKMTTTTATIEECEEIIQSIRGTVGEENMIFSNCEAMNVVG